jgi:hypothetical protein
VTAPTAESSTLDSSPADIVIRSQLNDILELFPSVPRLYRLTSMLQGMEYDENDTEMSMSIDDDNDSDSGPPGVVSARQRTSISMGKPDLTSLTCRQNGRG